MGMNGKLVGYSVKHKMLGTGTVVEQDNTYIKVTFKNRESKFPFPDAFESFLQIDDADIQLQIKELLANKKELAIIEKQKKEQQ